MSANHIVAIAAASANSILGLIVYLRNPRSFLNRMFWLFTVGVSGWIMGVVFLELTANLTWFAILSEFAVIMSISFVILSRFFPTRDEKISKWFFILLFSSALLVTLLIVIPSDLVVKGIITREAGGALQLDLGPGWSLIMLYASVITLYGISRLILKYRYVKGMRKLQLKYLFYGFALFFALIVFTNVIIPTFGVYQLASFGPAFSIFFVGFTAYAIVKHRLMDIKLVVARSVTYSVLLFAICGLFVSIVYYLQSSYARALHVNPNIPFIIAGVVVAFGFEPLRRFLARITDRIFFKDRYDPQELLGKFSKVMGSAMILDPLLGFILKTLKSEVKISKVALVLVGQDDGVYDMRLDGFKLSSSSVERVVDLCRTKRTVVVDELEDELKEREFLRELDISVLLPLVSEDSLEGVLVLGDKKSGDMFTGQDIQFLELLTPEVAIAVKNALLFEERNRRVSELSALNKLAFSMGSGLDLKSILNQAIGQAIQLTEADSGSIMLLDEENQALTIRAAKGIKKEILEKTRIGLGEGIAGWVAAKNEALILVDGLDSRFQEDLRREDIISSLNVPLRAKKKVIGVLNVNRKVSDKLFSKADLELVTTFAAEVAVSIENAKLYKDLQNTFLGTILALAAAVDAKDHYTFGHSKHVTELAVATAQEIGLSDSQIEVLRIASTLHDIGKIGIDGSILNKPGKLSPEEREVINSHPAISANILKSLEFLKDVVPLILFHHERFDGKGYPTGISGQAIPIGARIIAVADSFNAMVSDRPYRKAMSFEVAIKELRDNAGTQFNPNVVEAFLKVLSTAKPEKKKSEPSAVYAHTKPIPKKLS